MSYWQQLLIYLEEKNPDALSHNFEPCVSVDGKVICNQISIPIPSENVKINAFSYFF